MKAVIQRVKKAQVSVGEEIVGSIQVGFLILLGITHDDTEEDVTWLVQKIEKLRVFSDDQGAMNLDLNAVNGAVLVVSQFTLFANYKKGNRPSFINAAHPDHAKPLYQLFIEKMQASIPTQQGIFGADMQITLQNDGPVTILMDTKNKE
ncbi:MAG: D-tyrosyl-tRNA(Tyr) deacylase [Chitinophagia bacterium]|jgi:D-tyrosyl-tRNA(Tyr) deacylase|nr:D-tyrosyl-tRNA(Tyr) deacylase [Chitinophagia bacterium]